MRIPLILRGSLIALVAMLGVGLHSAIADSGNIALTVYKGGWIIGGSAGSGALYFRGRTYGLGIGGLDYGLVFGGSKTVLHGRSVWRLYEPRFASPRILIRPLPRWLSAM